MILNDQSILIRLVIIFANRFLYDTRKFNLSELYIPVHIEAQGKIENDKSGYLLCNLIFTTNYPVLCPNEQREKYNSLYLY